MTGKTNNMEYTYFWKNKSPLSQWYGDWMSKNSTTYDGSFEVGVFKYRTAEHYMMAEKALLFNDYEACHKILNEKHPRDVQKEGRLISNFDQAKWDEHKEEIVYQGNYAKFSQHGDLRRKLLNTADTILVEASPHDSIWGIGLDEMEAKTMEEKYWPGLNLLGKVLMRVRAQLRKDIAEIPDKVLALDNKLKGIRQAKSDVVKSMQYEKAAGLRDDEKAVMKEIELLKESL